MLACGFYQFKAAELAPIRDRMIEKPKEFAKVLKDLEEANLSLSEEDKLKTESNTVPVYPPQRTKLE